MRHKKFRGHDRSLRNWNKIKHSTGTITLDVRDIQEVADPERFAKLVAEKYEAIADNMSKLHSQLYQEE